MQWNCAEMNSNEKAAKTFQVGNYVHCDMYQAILIRIFLKRYNKLCSPLLYLLNMRCFSVKINKILVPGKHEH